MYCKHLDPSLWEVSLFLFINTCRSAHSQTALYIPLTCCSECQHMVLIETNLPSYSRWFCLVLKIFTCHRYHTYGCDETSQWLLVKPFCVAETLRFRLVLFDFHLSQSSDKCKPVWPKVTQFAMLTCWKSKHSLPGNIIVPNFWEVSINLPLFLIYFYFFLDSSHSGIAEIKGFILLIMT